MSSVIYSYVVLGFRRLQSSDSKLLKSKFLMPIWLLSLSSKSNLEMMVGLNWYSSKCMLKLWSAEFWLEGSRSKYIYSETLGASLKSICSSSSLKFNSYGSAETMELCFLSIFLSKLEGPDSGSETKLIWTPSIADA